MTEIVISFPLVLYEVSITNLVPRLLYSYIAPYPVRVLVNNRPNHGFRRRLDGKASGQKL